MYLIYMTVVREIRFQALRQHVILRVILMSYYENRLKNDVKVFRRVISLWKLNLTTIIWEIYSHGL